MSRPGLPLFWDGYPIDWGRHWRSFRTSLSFHVDDFLACHECGSLTPTLHKVGVFFSKGKRLRHSPLGRHKARPRRLFASRCPDCLHTTVLDWRGQGWTLGPEDYGDRGSRAPEVPETAQVEQAALF
ncbi:hypothetical protein [Nesterenkonia rhizosphaerae]|uniref:Uncharacterized protein n=1 Tax=Nesterenkonia rhizosphaerae TaxID=1348272 RepID=A0ABP9FW81_9MICC